MSRPALAMVATALVLLAPAYARTHWQLPALPHLTVIDLSTE